MSNRHEEELSKVLHCIFRDAVRAYPALRSDIERDLERFDQALNSRGLQHLLVDMPAARKHLDRCLSEGQYVPSSLPLTKRVSKRVVIPKFLRGLYLLVFEETGALKAQPDTEAIFFLRQILSACQKYTIPCSPEKTEACVSEFFELDRSMPEPDWFWQTNHPTQDDLQVFRGFAQDPDILLRCDDNPEHGWPSYVSLTLLDQVSALVTSALGPYDPMEWKFRHGPGAISQVTKPTNKYNWFDWSGRLDRFFHLSDCGYHNYMEWARSYEALDVPSPEPRSRLVAVPKSYSSPRLIAAEPSEHQWCQQNLWHYFCERSRRSWISGFVRFRDQSLNQHLCLEGSKDGSLCTIDLSSASDRVTCAAVANLFRVNPTLLMALQACRTRMVSQNLSTRYPALHVLNKFSTMGSACTFPVETLLFLSIAIAGCLEAHGVPATKEVIGRYIGKVAVFGDDIIVPTDCREEVVRLLELVGFKINANKSFWNGNFRESCGVDAFRGVNVTPAYLRKPFDTQPEAVASNLDVSNNFFRKFLIHTAQFVASTLGQAFPTLNVASGVGSLNTFGNPTSLPNKARFNRSLQRWEYLIPVLSSTGKRTPTNDASALHQYFTESPDPMLKWSHGFAQRSKLKIKLRWVPAEELLLKQL